jgi:hypothetical protein
MWYKKYRKDKDQVYELANTGCSPFKCNESSTDAITISKRENNTRRRR